MLKIDSPHSDTTWPDSMHFMNERIQEAGLTLTQPPEMLRRNAERLFPFQPDEPPTLYGN
jgi:hypothetical protein